MVHYQFHLIIQVMKKYSIPPIIILFLCYPYTHLAQNFTNPVLDGSVGYSIAPTGWTHVPYTDPDCDATDPLYATTDLCNLSGPDVSYGIKGRPMIGNTFVSALYMFWSGVGTYHEGIQQTVTGLTIGGNYTLYFHQAVVKQGNCLDQSGAWSVYVDGSLLGTSAVSVSTLPYNSDSLTWEARTMSFTATSTSHTFKFLPFDDDADIALSSTNTSGALRMGIDRITFDATLPLYALRLKSSKNSDGTIELYWNKPSASKNTSYVVEKSIDGKQYNVISTTENLSWNDKNIRSSTNYYRVKTVNEPTIYSNIVYEKTDFEEFDIGLSSQKIIITPQIDASQVTIQLFDPSGKRLLIQKINNCKKQIPFDITLDNVNKGIHLLVVETEGIIFQNKIIKY